MRELELFRWEEITGFDPEAEERIDWLRWFREVVLLRHKFLPNFHAWMLANDWVYKGDDYYAITGSYKFKHHLFEKYNTEAVAIWIYHDPDSTWNVVKIVEMTLISAGLPCNRDTVLKQFKDIAEGRITPKPKNPPPGTLSAFWL